MKTEEKTKLKIEVLQKKLDYYRKLEIWGSSLFLGAIAYLAIKFIEWKLEDADKFKSLEISSLVFLVPCLMGVISFIFLRVVNDRGHKSSSDLQIMIDEEKPKISYVFDIPGLLGWIFAWMPSILGFFVSWIFIFRDSVPCEIKCVFYCLCALFLIIFVVALHFQINKQIKYH